MTSTVANAINLGNSTAGQVAASQGAGAAQKWVNNQTLSGAVLIDTQTAANSAAVVFVSDITNTYNNYRLIGYNIVLVTQGQIQIQCSANNGSSYDSTADHYGYYGNTYSIASSVTQAAINSTTTGYIEITSNVSASYTASLILDIMGPANIYSSFSWMCSAYDGTNSYRKIAFGAGTYADASAMNAFQILSNNGNISTGTFKLYGMK